MREDQNDSFRRGPGPVMGQGEITRRHIENLARAGQLDGRPARPATKRFEDRFGGLNLGRRGAGG